ncbi:superoxide dismutase [Cu-Zn] 2, chloroplastic isoform X2 [Drosophila willistoni]|uniref:superoxide dismutase [Cu-Zn] 2, chloroplastic isoform X2 n=1 Tax=Drosophila willistoni TaxID=7260 RepID=UPI000C26C8A3|nr:superoxide dismutase [Cu-Zn] 2, chloroplastic isoform X2 [Drosophila willistoni]
MFIKLILLGIIWCNGIFMPGKAQNLVDRLRPVANVTRFDDGIKVVSGTKVKRYERLTVPLGGIGPVGLGSVGVGGGAAGLLGPLLNPQPAYLGYAYWLAGAKLMGDGEGASDVAGMITFQQLPYNSDIKVTINVTGLPPGKHALHIHSYGDLSDGCKSTGGQFPNNFLGNVDTKEDGSISGVFMSIYLQLFGFNGIVGRSIVIHSKPIDLNTALNAEVFSSSLQAMPNALAYQNEENSVGPAIACGVISLMSSSSSAVMASTSTAEKKEI